MNGPPDAGAAERGSAVAEFVLVSALLVALFLAVFQLALALHVRVLVVDAAAEGARVAARADRDLAAGAARTRDLLTAALDERYARSVSVRETTRSGLPVVEVTVRAPLPVVGLLGPGGTLTATGHALDEDA
ncbi:TadE-like protein [Isoptericola jiangsuensis]|uniref:TadE-like protein n=1 Tax=Isoptericola jiangsuensis TaxID=548579 RepID=A0A2A9EUX4_9MICO|nr:TadE/TadG family type IV pilus assembly protein [Isoptericola jiangsuensis]PFG42553.1 TadE-like protein [Isoptericola jiangsuensis]